MPDFSLQVSVATQGLSGNKAADLHGVPHSTLKDRLSGRVVHSTRPGPKSYLSPTEEADLATHLMLLTWGLARLGGMSNA